MISFNDDSLLGILIVNCLYDNQNAVQNCSLQAAAEEQRKADEKVMKLAEEQKVTLFP